MARGRKTALTICLTQEEQQMAIEPVTDIAVLGALDGQGFHEECHAFEDWCANTPPVPLCVQNFPLFEPFPVYIFTHTAKWIQAAQPS